MATLNTYTLGYNFDFDYLNVNFIENSTLIAS